MFLGFFLFFCKNLFLQPISTALAMARKREPYLPLPSQPKLVLIYRPRWDGRLSWRWVAGWLHTEIGGGENKRGNVFSHPFPYFISCLPSLFPRLPRYQSDPLNLEECC